MTKSILLLLVLLLSSCASAPVNYGMPSPDSNIGFLYLVDHTPKHAHVGTTIFQNEDTVNASTTDYIPHLTSKMTEVLAAADYKVSVVEATEILLEDRLSLFNYMMSNTQFTKKVQVELDQIAEQYELDYVFVVYPVSWPDNAYSSAEVDGYGIFTRCGMGNCRSAALNHIEARIYDVTNQSSLRAMKFKPFSMPEYSLVDSAYDEDTIPEKDVDAAADLAIENFLRSYTEMLRTSEFIH